MEVSAIIMEALGPFDSALVVLQIAGADETVLDSFPASSLGGNADIESRSPLLKDRLSPSSYHTRKAWNERFFSSRRWNDGLFSSSLGNKESLLEEFLRESQEYRRLSSRRPTVFVERSRNPRIARSMIAEAHVAARGGHKDCAHLLEEIIGVIEIVEPPRRQGPTNALMSLSQLLVAIPITLYKPTRQKGSSAESNDSVTACSAGTISQWQTWLTRQLDGVSEVVQL
jgi:hypothetical protein